MDEVNTMCFFTLQNKKILLDKSKKNIKKYYLTIAKRETFT